MVRDDSAVYDNKCRVDVGSITVTFPIFFFFFLIWKHYSSVDVRAKKMAG